MTACTQQLYAYEKSLQLIEEFVRNGSLHVSEKSFHALYKTYERLVDISSDSEKTRANNFTFYKDCKSLSGSKNSTSPDAVCKKTEKRLHPRLKLQGYIADIVQGGFAYTAYVRDASLEGIQLQNLPAKFYSIREEKFTVIISSIFESMQYELTAYSKWRKLNDESVAVGFHLVDAPVAWNRLINMTTF